MPPDVETIRLNGPQSYIAKRFLPGNTVVLPWGRGVGKSAFMRWMMWSLIARLDGRYRNLRNAVKMGDAKRVFPREFWKWPAPPALRGVRIAAVCDTLQHFRDIHQALIMEELSTTWAGLRHKVDKRTLRIDFPGGSWFQPFPADEANAQKGRGIRCDVVLVEECDDVDPGVFDSVVKPWFSEPWSLRMCMAVGTPRRGRHGLLWQMHSTGLAEQRERDDGITVRDDDTKPNHYTRHATAYDAPGNVSVQYVEEVKRTTPKETFKREWMCDFDAAEGLVYDVFEESFHVREPHSKRNSDFTRIIIGCDWGYVDPQVFLVLGIQGHGRDATTFLLEEHYETGQTLDYWKGQARQIHDRYPKAVWWADPSRPDTIQALRDFVGMDMRPADNTVEDGVGCVADRLFIRGQVDEESGVDGRWAHLYISPSCVNTIREFHEYRRKRDPHNRELYLEKIEGKNDHAMDGIRYPLFNTFGKVPSYRHSWTAAA